MTVAKLTRSDNIDKLKGFLIICVIIGHFVFVPAQYKSQFASNGLLNIMGWLFSSFKVYYYHIPLFLFLNFYLTNPTNDWGKVFNRVLIFFTTYLFWANWMFVIKCIHHIAHPDILVPNLVKIAHNILFGNWYYCRSVYWFLPVIIVINLGIYIYNKANANWRIYIKLSLLLIFTLMMYYLPIVRHYHVNGSIPYGVDIVLYLLPLFYILKHIIKKEFKINYYLLFIVLILAIYIFEITQPELEGNGFSHRIDLAQLSVPTNPLNYLLFIIINLAVYQIFVRLKPGNFKFLVFIGKYTLPIFILHLFVQSVFIGIIKKVYFDKGLSAEPLYVSIKLVQFICMIYVPAYVSILAAKYIPATKYIGFRP